MKMKKEFSTIDDPSEISRTQKVNTEFYLGRLAFIAAQAGVNKQLEPQTYKNCVEQLEILGLGSDLLNKEYDREKEKLQIIFNNKLSAVTKSYNPKIHRSTKNKQVELEVKEINLDYITALHKLLIKFLSPLFYTKYVYEKI